MTYSHYAWLSLMFDNDICCLQTVGIVHDMFRGIGKVDLQSLLYEGRGDDDDIIWHARIWDNERSF